MKDALELLNFASASVAVNEDAEAKKAEALEAAGNITEIADSFDNECAVEAVRDIKSIMSDVESCRKTVKAPVLKLGKAIDQAAKDFCGALITEQARVQKLITGYADEQRKIAWEAEKARRAEQERLERERQAAAEELKKAETPEETYRAKRTVAKAVQAEADNKAISTAPEKVSGLVVTRRKDFRIVDIDALHKARPDLVHVMPKRSEILEAIKTTDKIPGLEIFEETKTSIRK